MNEGTQLSKLTADEAIEKGMSMVAVVKYYLPEASNDFADFFIWEKTCFPMSTETEFQQIYESYQSGELKKEWESFCKFTNLNSL